MKTENYLPVLDLPPSPLSNVGFLVLGVVAGFFLPRVVSLLAIQFIHLAASGVSGWAKSVALVSYAVLIPVVWALWRRRYLAIGILIGASVNALFLASTFVLWWWVVRGGR